MPKGREEKFNTHISSNNVTLVRKGSKYDKVRQDEEARATKHLARKNEDQVRRGARKRVADYAGFSAASAHATVDRDRNRRINSQVTPGKWETQNYRINK